MSSRLYPSVQREVNYMAQVINFSQWEPEGGDRRSLVKFESAPTTNRANIGIYFGHYRFRRFQPESARIAGFARNLFSEATPYNYAIDIYVPSQFFQGRVNTDILKDNRGTTYLTWLQSMLDSLDGAPLVFKLKEDGGRQVTCYYHSRVIDAATYSYSSDSDTYEIVTNNPSFFYTKITLNVIAAVDDPLYLAAAVHLDELYIATNPGAADSDGFIQATPPTPYPRVPRGTRDLSQILYMTIEIYRVDNTITNAGGDVLVNAQETVAGTVTIKEDTEIIPGDFIIDETQYILESFIRLDKGQGYLTLTRNLTAAS